MKLLVKAIGLFIFTLAISCANRITPAPIVNATPVPQDPPPSIDEPIATSSEKSSLDTKKSATETPKVDKVDEEDNVTTNEGEEPNADNDLAVDKKADTKKAGNNLSKKWTMPAKGTVTEKFSLKAKGISISGKVGEPVVAVTDGKVLYSGNALKGYGNLVIIKHNGDYLSAYANNKINLVKQGVEVKSGQKIAEMGVGKNGQGKLHFEVRKKGKPIDPLSMITND